MRRLHAHRWLTLLLALVTVLTLTIGTASAATVNVLNGQIQVSDTANRASVSGEEVTVTVYAAEPGILDGNNTQTNTITVTNKSGGKATIQFNYTVSNQSSFTINGSSSVSSPYSTTLAAGDSITISMSATASYNMFGDGNKTATLSLSGFSVTPIVGSANVTATYDSSLGSVKGYVGGAETVLTSGVQATIGTDKGITAYPNSGVKFLGWINSADNTIITTNATYSPDEDATVSVRAAFASPTGNAWFQVGSKLYDDLNTANTAAGGSGIIILAANGTLPAGDYTISAGNTLLIPFDNANTLYREAPGLVDNAWTQPTAYRTLTMAGGAHITVNGEMSLSAKQNAAGGSKRGSGSPTGPVSFVKMEKDSSITVNSGGKLYAWGYITKGASGEGTVLAKAGSHVYEDFQFEDFRGGSETSDMNSGPFPLSQYYVQNIEVPLTIEAGATEHSYTSMYISTLNVGSNGSSVAFISDSGAMFNLTQGSVTKRYDGATDRLIIDTNGATSMEISSISISIRVSVLSETIDSADYELPINSNITVNINEGSTVTVKQRIALLPGAVINVADGAQCFMTQNMYVYDADEWKATYVGPSKAAKFLPVQYAPSRTYNRTDADLVDAKVIIGGSVTGDGGVPYTTESGAAVVGETGGVIEFTPAANGTTTMHVQDVGDESINVTSAKLQNGDGFYKTTGDYPNGTAVTFVYKEDKVYDEGKEVMVERWHDEGCGGTYTHNAAAEGNDPATCAKEGIEVWSCGCSSNPYTYDKPIAKKPHENIALADRVLPNCTTDGNISHYYCADCQGYFFDEVGTQQYIGGKDGLSDGTLNGGVKLAATGHNLETAWTTRIDSADGTTYRWHACQNFGCPGPDNTTNGYHTCSGGTATCQSAATCEKCGNTYGTALPHDLGEQIARVEPTCEVDGMQAYYECSSCGELFWDAAGESPATAEGLKLAATGHKFEAGTGGGREAQAPTCTQVGWEDWHMLCDHGCGTPDPLDYVEIPATGHNWSDGWTGDATGHWHPCLNANCPVTNNEEKEGFTPTHTPENDDGDCATAIACSVCDHITTAAKTHVYTGTWVSGNDDTHYQACTNDNCQQKKSEACSGGEATCTAAAVCTKCGNEYGDVDSTKHDFSSDWSSDGTEHWHKCTRCGTEDSKIEHSGTDDGNCETAVKCGQCGYTITAAATHTYTYTQVTGTNTHTGKCTNLNGQCTAATQAEECSGGEATCQSAATCEDCGGKYGDPAEHSYGAEWEKDDTNHWHACSVCGVKDGEIAHSLSNDGNCTNPTACTVCGYTAANGAEQHTWGDWVSGNNGTHSRVCTVSGCNGNEVQNCSGGTADCMNKAVCTTCDTAYGEVDNTKHAFSSDWSRDGTNHWHQCTRCDAMKDQNAHTAKADDGNCATAVVCTECGYTVTAAKNHAFGDWTSNGDGTHSRTCANAGCQQKETGDCSGDTATCQSPAVCKDCGGSYGGTVDHVWDTEWSKDETKHWKVCTTNGCNETTEPVGHFGGEATCQTQAACQECGTSYGQLSDHSFTTYEDYQPAACGKNATQIATCDVVGCNATDIRQKEGTALEHSFGAWTSNKNDTHTRKCDNCVVTETEACSGGEANCVSEAKCDVCGNAYGSKNPANHTWDTDWTTENGQHWHKCLNGCVQKTELAACSGGTATCQAKAVCSTCNTEYGALVGHVWATALTNGGEDGHWYACQTKGCTEKSGKEAHDAADRDCTTRDVCECGYVVAEADEHSFGAWTSNGNNTHTRKCGKCDVTETKDCSGGTATCTAAATCADCHTAYGTALGHDWDKSQWQTDESGHWYACKRTGCEEKNASASHTGSNGGDCTKPTLCTVCNYQVAGAAYSEHNYEYTSKNGTHDGVCTHDGCNAKVENETCSGGEATCQTLATCTKCGGSHGVLASHTDSDNDHYCDECNAIVCEDHNYVSHAEVSPTCTTTGLTAYSKCEECGLYDGAAPMVIPVLGHMYDNTWQQANDQHWQICTREDCGAASAKESCSGGAAATCAAKSVCVKCGNEYGDFGDHDWAEAWSHGDGYHWHACETVGCTLSDVTLMGGYAEHTPKTDDGDCTTAVLCSKCNGVAIEAKKHTGGSATCTGQATCVNCGKAYGDVLGHSFTNYVSDGNATCSTDGTKTAQCDHSCGEKHTVTDEGSALDHDFISGDTYLSDAEGHQKKCARCNEYNTKQKHTGGSATCTAQAKCEVCQNTYGGYAEHDWAKTPSSNETHHWYACTNPACTKTNDSATHTGGTADCVSKAKCDVCGKEYGKELGHKWASTWTSDETGHWHECSNNNCPVTDNTLKDGYAEHAALTDDGDCTTAIECECGYVMQAGSGKHTYGNWKSNGDGTHTGTCTNDGCQKQNTGNCSGGKATCQSQAVCSTCNEKYGSRVGHVWAAALTNGGEDGHWYACETEGCTEKSGAEAHDAVDSDCTSADICRCGHVTPAAHTEHNYVWTTNNDSTHNGDCANCDAVVEDQTCTGGKATCVAAAVCEKCNTAYGNVDTVNGHDWDTEWSSNENGHWHTCKNGCTAKKDDAAHDAVDNDCTSADTCQCGHVTPAAHTEHSFGGWTQVENTSTHIGYCQNDGCAGESEPETCSGGNATCTEKAICEKCESTYGDASSGGHDWDTETWVSDATGHWHVCKRTGCGEQKDFAEHNGSNGGDCTAEVKCTECGRKVSDAAHTEHNYVWTTNNNGTHNGDCANEGCTVPSKTEDCSGGNATCQSEAVCSTCNEKYGSRVDHVWAAALTNGGEDGHWYACETEGCTAKSGAKAHDAVDSDCTSADKCQCGHVTPAAQTEHSFGGWTQVENTSTHIGYCQNDGCAGESEPEDCSGGTATCTEKAICEKCESTYGDLSKHSLQTVPGKGASCTEDGYSVSRVCKVCGHIDRPSTPIPATGHTPAAAAVIENKVDATCTAAGSYDEVVYCTVSGCGGEVSRTKVEIPIKPHTPGLVQRENVVNATCMVDGSYDNVTYCSVCEQVASRTHETIPATGHTDVEIPAVEATCSAVGATEGTKCSVCQEVLVAPQEIAKLPHTPEVLPGKKPTCKEPGATEGSKCSVCNEILVAGESIPVIDHDWGTGRLTVNPKCGVEGERTFTCSMCRETKTEVEPALEHDLETIPAQEPTYTAIGWNEYQRCKRESCGHTTAVWLPALGAPSIENYSEFIENLAILEEITDNYVKKVSPGKDPAMLIIKYIRTGVDRYNSGSWNIMAGYEDQDFAKYITDYEAEYNRTRPAGTPMMKVTGLKNLENFNLPAGDLADVGHIFGLMDISYTNKTSPDHGDVAGWAGDTVDLLSAADQYGVTSATVETMTEEIRTKYFLLSSGELENVYGEEPIEGSFGLTDMRGDMDGYYIMQQLLSEEYTSGMLTELFDSYMTPDLTDEQRADYFLKNRLGGVTLRGDVRDAVYNVYCANSVVGTLEGTREFNSGKDKLNDMRKAVCNVVADYLCRLAGDFVEDTDNNYLTVFDTKTSTLAPGVTQKIFNATTADDQTMVYYVATADVTRDDVHVYANYHDNDPGKGWQMQRVLDQSLAAQANYSDPENPKYIKDFNIVAATNAGGYDMSDGTPGGLLVMEGKEWYPSDGTDFFAILKDGTAMIGTQAEYETLKAQGQIKEAIGGFGTTLLRDGKVAITRTEAYYTSRASRTAVGVTATGKVVFLVVDGRQIGLSCGASMEELAQIMLDAGCCDAINLDGGGSSTYVAKPEGESELRVVSNPSDGAPRSVSTSLFVASTAPSSNEFDHAVIESDYNYMSVGSSVNLTARGVSATGTPLPLPEGAEWSVKTDTLGTITQDGVFTGTALGDVIVELKLDGEVIGTKKLYVVIPDNVYFAKEKINVIYGVEVELPIRAVYEGKEVVIGEDDVVLSLANPAAGTIDGIRFTGDETSGVRSVIVNGALAADQSIKASMTVNLFSEDEASFDFDNVTGGDRQFAYNREVSNSTQVGTNIYNAVDREQDMVTSYTFALDMSVIPIPPQLADLTYMLPGADMENASAWNFLLQLAERVSVLTNVTPELVFDKRFDVDYSDLTVSNEYFVLDKDKTTFDETTNTLKLSMNWVDQEQPIDPDTANPLCIVSGIKLIPRADADWGADEQIVAAHEGEISYDIYLRANALYSFSQKPENQEQFNLYPFENKDVIIGGSTEKGGHFSEVYTTFSDTYTLSKSDKNGWVMEGGGWAYYEAGVRYTGFKTVEGLYYAFGEDGINIGQKTHTGAMTIEGEEYYAVNGVLFKGWQVVDPYNVNYYNAETGVKEALAKAEVPSTCIVNGYCDYTPETAPTKRVPYDDAGGHEWQIQSDGSRKCTRCGHVRIEMSEVTVELSNYKYTYSGNAYTPTTKVTAPDGTVLTNPSTSNLWDESTTPATKVYDYASTYRNNVQVGTATVTVTAQRYGKYGDLNDWFGNAAGSQTVSYEILPDLPTKVRCEDGTDGLAKVTWQAAKAPGVTYVLYKSTDGENWIEFAATEQTFYELDPAEFEGCQISLKTRKVVGEKAYESLNRTNPVTLTLNVTVTNNEAGQPKLTWDLPVGVVDFIVYRSTAEDGEFIQVFSTKGLSYTHSSGTPGRTYWYRVEAVLDTEAKRTEVVAATVLNTTEDFNLQAANRIDGKPVLTWNAISGATGYEIQYNITGTEEFSTLATTDQTTWAHVDATLGETYYYRVEAIFTGETEKLSTTVQCTCEEPNVVLNLTPGNNDLGKPMLTWSAIPGAASYEVYASQQEDTGFEKLGDVAQTTFTHEAAEVGSTWYYKVKVLFTGGGDYLSDTVVATCLNVEIPISVAVSNRADGKILLTWNTIEGAASYEIWRAATEDGEFARLDATQEVTYADLTAQIDQTFFYKIKVILASGVEDFSNVVTGTCITPDVSWEIKPDHNEEGKPTLSWKAVEGAISYKVYRCTTEDGEYQRVLTTKGTTYTHVSATAGRTYYYKVEAIFSGGATHLSDAVSNVCLIPGADFEITIGHNEEGKPTLDWLPLVGAIQYEVYRSTTEEGTYNKVFTTKGTSYTHVSAAMGKTYYYYLKAIYADGTTKDSDVVVNTFYRPDNTLTIIPGNNAEGKPTLKWNEITGAIKYQVWRCTTEGGEYQRVLTTTGTTYTHISATAGKTYYYKVRPVFAEGNGEFSDVVRNECRFPDAQFDLVTGHRDDGKPTLDWEHIEGAAQYEVLRSTTEDGKYAKVFTTKGTSYTHVSATAGRTYYYQVRAIFGDGTEVDSEIVSNTCIIPGVQWDITTGHRDDGKPTLEWEHIEGAVQYEVLRSTTEDGEYAKVFTTKGTTYTHTSAMAGRTYYYKVRATLADGTTDTSDSVSNICIIPGVQWDITTGNNKEGKPTLEWEHIEGAAQYEVLRATEEDGKYAKVFTTKGTTYTHASATAGKTYYYKVRVTLNDGTKDTSDWVVNTCTIMGVVFDITTGHNAEGKPTLEWEHIEAAAQYEVLRATEEDGTYTKVFTTKGTTYTHASATPGKTYYYKLRVTLNDGGRETSDAVDNYCKILEAVFDVTPGNDENGKPTLDWEHIEGAAQYYVFRSTERKGEYEEVFDTKGTSYTHENATPNRTYYYYLLAVMNDGSEVESEVFEIECLAPVDVEWNITTGNRASDGKPTLKWEDIPGAISYEVQRSTREDGTYTTVLETEFTTYTHLSATAGKTYYYQIVALFSDGTKVTSHVVSNSTVEQEDEILVVADFNEETGKPQLSWSAVSGAVYEVYRSESEDGTFVSVFQTDGTSYTHETAESGVTYYYKVVAILEDGTELESFIVAHGYEE